MSLFVIVVYSNGRKYEGPEGIMFEGRTRPIQVKRSISLERLKERIQLKLKLEANQIICGLTYRMLACEKSNTYIAVDLFDDEDVELMFNSFEQHSSMTFMEVYADVATIESDCNVVTTEVGCSSIPVLSCPMNTQQSVPFENENIETTITREYERSNVGVDLSDDDDDCIRDPIVETSEDEDAIPDDESTDTDIDGEFDVNVGDDAQDIGLEPHVPSPITCVPASTSMPSANVYQGGAPISLSTQLVTPSPHFSYINWEHPDQESDFPGLDVRGSWSPGDELYVGLRFDSKESVQLALKHYSLRRHQSYVVVESNPITLCVRCSRFAENCNWRMRAIMGKKSGKWEIRKWGGPHTCVNPVLSQDHRQLDSNMICSCILGMINTDPSVTISLIRERIESSFGYKVSYRKAWKAKQKAIVKVFGDWDESYAMLPRWLEAMRLYAPGSVYVIATNEYFVNNRCDNRFQTFHRVFWCFKQCCDAFNYCKPIIQIDGTHLYGKYRGTLLIATTQDGNSCVLPIAFAIVEGETLSAWSWFLAHIRAHVTDKQGLCLISDRHASIISAVNNQHLGWHPPHAHHVYCIRHIASNFNHKFKNTKLKADLMKLGYTVSQIQFERRLTRFRETSEAVRIWIDRIPKEKWSQAWDHGRRYGHMTTNLSECVNKVLKGVRNLPITSLVKSTYYRMVEYFVKRSTQAITEAQSGQKYCQTLVKAMLKNQEDACSHQVVKFDRENTRFEVVEKFNPVTQKGGTKWSLKLTDVWCECGEFQAFRYPCSHAIAACAAVRLDAWQFVDPVYTLEHIIHAYSGQWYPIGNEECLPEGPSYTLRPDERTVRQKGRPKSTRIRNEMDWTDKGPKQRCKSCLQEGHNRRSCPTRRVCEGESSHQGVGDE